MNILKESQMIMYKQSYIEVIIVKGDIELGRLFIDIVYIQFFFGIIVRIFRDSIFYVDIGIFLMDIGRYGFIGSQ